MKNTPRMRIFKNLCVVFASYFAAAPSGWSYITSGTWGCSDMEVDGLAFCTVFAACEPGDADLFLYAAAWSDITCPNQPVMNDAYSNGAVGGIQVSAFANGISLYFGRQIGYILALSDSCWGGGGQTYENFDPNGCNPPPPPPPPIGDGGGGGGGGCGDSGDGCDYCCYNPDDPSCAEIADSCIID